MPYISLLVLHIEMSVAYFVNFSIPVILVITLTQRSIFSVAVMPFQGKLQKVTKGQVTVTEPCNFRYDHKIVTNEPVTTLQFLKIFCSAFRRNETTILSNGAHHCSGAALGRFDRLLQIGPRAERGPRA